ncbi:hypothetical protein, partial [Pseudomonas sp. FW306-02-F02-AB]|uniref:hypothetical protein n=1 Tax=Pseudomonas sp. FW306-02-F02-AB TaxID=2070653 RepID=UPI001C496A4B
MLKQNPALCATAAKTINFISGTDLRNNGAFMVGMLGASAALAWLGPEALLGTALEGVSGGVLASAAAVPVSLGMYAHTY